MDSNLLYIILFLLLSAFFSGSETAFFSLTKIQIKKLELLNTPTASRIVSLLKKPRRLLITILLGNTIVNIAASTFGALVVLEYTKFLGMETVPVWLLTISMVIMTVLLLIFGEITPKLLAISKSEKFAGLSSGILVIFSFILYPFIAVLVLISRLTSHKVETNHLSRTKLTGQDLQNIVNSKPKHLPLDENEKKIISGIFKFTTTDAKKIMVPRVDIISVSLNEDLEQIKQRIIESGHSRLPVYNKNIDDITGIIFAKDIILTPSIQSIKKILREPIYVTENTNIQNLLNIFLSRKTHLAIVVDEYGGTSGLITLENVLEELVGEIIDEYDKEQPMLTKTGVNEYSASGMLDIAGLNHELDIAIDADKYDNLAAFLYDEFNRVPDEGEKITFDEKILFQVTEVKNQRIEKVKIIVIE